MSEYQPVPVEDAKEVADRRNKSMVVIVAKDEVFGRIHVATFGAKAEDKINAAYWGDLCTVAVGGSIERRATYEDFRSALDSAIYAEAIAILKAISRQAFVTHAQLQRIDQLVEQATAEANKPPVEVSDGH